MEVRWEDGSMDTEHRGELEPRGRNQVVSNKQKILKAEGLNEAQSRNREVRPELSLKGFL